MKDFKSDKHQLFENNETVHDVKVNLSQINDSSNYHKLV